MNLTSMTTVVSWIYRPTRQLVNSARRRVNRCRTSVPRNTRSARGRRVATTTVELIVAMSLLTGLIGAATTLVFRHGRLLASYRDYQCALDELTNQLDRLTALPPTDVDAALRELKPSELAAERLSGAELRAEVESLDYGRRVTLSLTWDEPRRSEAPVRLAAWLVPAPSNSEPRP